MNDPGIPPPDSLQSVIGALLFAAKEPLAPEDLKKALQSAAQGAEPTSPAAAFAKATLAQIKTYLAESDVGLRLCEEGGRFSYRTVPAAGPWVRALVKAAPPQRLSRAALETLAVIAYRQPISRAEIESVRGVSVDHTIRALLELDLIRAVGRSELPGRPFLYGTTASFLEHFGLRSLKDLDPAPEA